MPNQRNLDESTWMPEPKKSRRVELTTRADQSRWVDSHEPRSLQLLTWMPELIRLDRSTWLLKDKSRRVEQAARAEKSR